jgi:glycosyltransferase involved in cell wall biosynthesis
MKISFCLITLNEEENLERCLSSFRNLADEIVILDSGSIDRTADIARAHGARFEHQPWQGYVAQKNSVLARASHDWIFSIDADEAFSPELYAEIARIKSGSPGPEVTGYSMPRCVLYEGRWIRHGDWYPDRLTRLFRRDKARFAGGKVHERLETSGRIIPLEGDLHHHSFRDAADHWARCQKYARLWAESKFEEGKSALPGAPFGHAVFRFARAYLARRGFLDGPLGLRIAWFAAREVQLKYSLLREMRSAREAGKT